jgi:hypothetical protein
MWLDSFQPLVNAITQIGGWIRSSHFLSMLSPELVVGFVPATCQCHRLNWWLDLFQPLVVVLFLVLVMLVVLLAALCCYK